MRSRILAAGSALLLLAGLIGVGAAPALADPPEGQVCEALDSGKHDTTGDPQSITVTAPHGELIDRYCVKAGNADQGNGPKYFDVSPPVKTLTFGYPGGKDVSHWSLSFVNVPRDAAATVSTTPATCAVGQTLVLGAVTHATWGTPTRTTGPGAYEVVATAVGDHLFPDGKSFIKFTGTLTGKLTGPLCDELASFVPAATAVDMCGTANDKVTLPPSSQLNYVVDDQRAGGVGTVTVTATAKPGFRIPNGVTASWTFEFTDVPCDVVLEIVTVPTMSDVCGTANDTLDLPEGSDGVSYAIDDQRVDGVGAVTVTASANAGFVLADGLQTEWVFKFTDTPCDVVVVPAVPSVTDEMCVFGDVVAGSITVTMVEGIQYRIVGEGIDVVVTEATTVVAPGTYTVTASALPGFVLDAEAEVAVIVAAAEVCGDLVTHPLVSPLASMTNLGCDTDGSYTLNDIEGVLWFVDGESVEAGTYMVSDARTVQVTAQADGPEYGLEFEAQTAWTFEFTEAEACGDLPTLPLDDLPTLALTGPESMSGLLLSSGLLLLFGGALLTLNRRKGSRVE